MSAADTSSPAPSESLWWHGGVIYQIYPRSFQDSNGDGVGDLQGIINRLPYIASLGVDAIWVSPFFKSPMKDFGYDVSDYRDIDPLFGTLDDFDRLIETAHAHSVRVMVDLVISHTSDQHPWFEASRQDRDNAKSDWYVWADAQPDGSPPNNWLSIFGGSAWQWDTRRMQYYLHNFLTSQPDLNFHNPEVQAATLDVARFWLERGVDGFRLDTINFYFHDAELRSNPPLQAEDRNATIAPAVNPYNWQEHLYSKNRPENIAFLEALRALTDQYDARACLGEVGDAQRGTEIMCEYTAGDSRMHTCYAFDFLETSPLTAARVARVFERLERAGEQAGSQGWPCWAFSNHDVARHRSRWQLDERATRAHAVLILCLRGTACLYQGEELGLVEAEVPFDALQDPYGIEFWPEYKGRDGCRTPMVWESNADHGGFSTATPWLPVSEDQVRSAANAQAGRTGSMLEHYRACIALRHAHPALMRGSQQLHVDGEVLHITRRLGDQTVQIALNLSAETARTQWPAGAWQLAASDHDQTTDLHAGTLELPAWGYRVAIEV
ncbi:MAG: alpha-amylase family glycosyl hydrolase [Pseudomonadota bacterium]